MAKEASKSKKEVKGKKDNKSFFKEFKAELKRVSWPTFKQLINNTTAVIVIVLITATIVFVLDVIFKSLNSYGVDNLKALVTSTADESLESDNIEQDGAILSENENSQDNNILNNEEILENIINQNTQSENDSDSDSDIVANEENSAQNN